MSILSTITICIFWFFMVKWFKENTCVFNDHEFEFKKNAYICKKCGLIKKVVKK